MILGIDPGYGKVGYGILHAVGNQLFHIAHGVIRTNPQKPLPFRLSEIYDTLTQIVKEYHPTESAVESLFFFRNVTTAISVSEARGVIQLCLFQCGLPIFEYTPHQVKQSVTGHGRAEKGQIQRSIRLLLHLEKTPKPDDAADGLAIAICHANSRKTMRFRTVDSI